MSQTRASLHLQNYPHPIVTRIQGKPTFTSLFKLHTEIKANAASVPSTRGGGLHGHLGIVLSPLKYSNISLTPFERPNDPGQPVLTGAMTWDQMQAVRLANRDQREAFDLVNTVESSLKQQIINAIDPEYLQELQNSITNTIEHPIHVIFDTLFQKYGRITKKQLQQGFAELANYNHNPTLPPDTVFSKIQEYKELADHAGSAISGAQQIDLAYVIFQNTGKFNRALRKWNEKPVHEQTWSNMKVHLNEAFDINQEFEGTTANEAGYSQQANLIAQQVTEQLEQRLPSHTMMPPQSSSPADPLILQSLHLLQEQMANLQLNMASKSNKSRSGNKNINRNGNTNNSNQNSGFVNNGYNYNIPNNFAPPNAPNVPPHFLPNYAPVVSPHNVPPHFLPNNAPVVSPHIPMVPPAVPPTQYHTNTPGTFPPQNVNSGFTPYGNHPIGNHPIGNHPIGNQPQQGQQRQQQRFRQPLPRAYCWTHGWCAHNGYSCNSPASGHIPQATLQNRMGGSNKNCT